MRKNKKGMEMWFWIVGAIIALMFGFVIWNIAGGSLSSAKSNIKTFQECESRPDGHCEKDESACNKPNEIASYKAFGCGDKNNKETKDKSWCCLPQP